MTKQPDQTRNLHPIKPAVAAMFIYHNEYAAQHDGSMDFWDGLTPHQKGVCERCVADILKARANQGYGDDR